jgi:hypothetical protein
VKRQKCDDSGEGAGYFHDRIMTDRACPHKCLRIFATAASGVR